MKTGNNWNIKFWWSQNGEKEAVEYKEYVLRRTTSIFLAKSDREIFNLKKNNTQIETAEVSSALKTRYPLC